ncbi:hypothetical protein cypCar_00045189 [Cyprinus carpio]|nr:hypothetical protein cypCar_00045189 [Cyprinus carpio]
MPKRSCPFSESFSSQYKVHVGQKEISNCGVLGLKYRQETYEKTKNLLFSGTRAVMGRLWKADGAEKASDALVSDLTAVSPAPGQQTLLKGQTRIGLDGRLQRADTAAVDITKIVVPVVQRLLQHVVCVRGSLVRGRRALSVSVTRVQHVSSSATSALNTAAPCAASQITVSVMSVSSAVAVLPDSSDQNR